MLTVTASLVVAYTIVPFLASRMLPRHEPAEGNAILRWLKRGIHVTYAPMVHAALRWPRSSLLLSLMLCFASLGLVKVIGFSLFPSADKPQFLVNVKAPEGSSIQATDRAVRFAETELLKHPEVLHVMANVGKGNPYIYYNIFPCETRASTGQLFVTLDRWDSRRTPALFEALRARFATYPDAQIVLRQFENGPPIEAPIAVRVVGPRLDDTRNVAAMVEDLMRRTPGTRDVVNPVRLQRIDYDLGIDREKAGLLGLDSLDVDRAVRLAVAGVPASTYRDAEGEEYDITVRGPVQGSPTRGQLEGFRLVTRTGQVVSLAQIAEPHFVSVTSRIERLNRERMVTITSNVQDGFVTGKVAEQIYGALATMTLPPGYRIAAGGEKQAAAKSFAGLGTAALVAVFGILAVLVLEFGSFRSTLIVVGVIPFGVLGAMLALAFTGHSLSYMAILGLIALIGVEIKNSILLVDFTNQLRREGVALDEAIETAGELRFLPVLLTSVTAIGGLLPLAVSGSALYSPLAIVMIGGLISSTVMARVITPVMYKLLPPVIVPVTDD